MVNAGSYQGPEGPDQGCSSQTLQLHILWFWWQQNLSGSYYHVTLGNPGDSTRRHALVKHPLYQHSRNARGSSLGGPHGVSAQAIII